MVMLMMNAYWKDIWRSVTKGKKRFLSIALIAALGVTMMCGLRASCEDLRYSADKFFDEQNLFDVRILSTLGLTEEDVEALSGLDEVALAEGGYSETVYTMVDQIRRSIEIRTLSEQEMNLPYLLEGRYPERPDEIVITKTYKNHTGKSMGDRILLTEESETLKGNEYIITGIVIDALDINSTEGSMGFRSTAATDYVGYIIPEGAENEIFTVVYLQMQGLEALNCYSEEYIARMDGYVGAIEKQIKTQREEARYQEIYDEAMEEWLDGKAEMLDEFAKADAEIADAKKELTDGKQKLADARKELEAAEKELNSQNKEADKAFAKAWAELADGYEQIVSGEAELEAGYQELLEGQRQLDEGKAELERQETLAAEEFAKAWEQLEAGEAELEAGIAEFESMKVMLDNIKGLVQRFVDETKALIEKVDISDDMDALIEQTIAIAEGYIAELEEIVQKSEISEEEKEEINAYISKIKDYLPKLRESLHETNILVDVRIVMEGLLDEIQALSGMIDGELETAYEQIEAGKKQLEEGKAELIRQETMAEEEFAKAKAAIEENQKKLDDGLREYQKGLVDLVKAKKDLEAGEQELRNQEASAKRQMADGRKQIQDGLRELISGEKELSDGEKELNDNLTEYLQEKAKAEKVLADALEEINDIDMTKWYVQDRTSLSGFSNVKSDADSIQAIGDIFPILFLTVAILISLTTITRMVEEERGLIGTYKALGFTNAEIRRKYILYAASACLIGGIVGDFAGYVILPAIIFIVFSVMYTIPEYIMQFDAVMGIAGILLFEVGVLGATAFSCQKALQQMPAKLMRPKAPKSGSRVLLERITFVWKRLSFLNKVTARNLFRYKKRLFMTIFGIAGCTALLLCGFTIKDTVSEMMPQQYEYIYKYDLMTVSADDDFEEMEKILQKNQEVADMIPIRMESIELLNEEEEETTVQLIVLPQGEQLEGYIHLRDTKEQKTELRDGDIMITKNATRVLNLEVGETVTLQTMDLKDAEVKLTQIVDNYFGNVIYMTEATYEDVFGEFACNGLLAKFAKECADQKATTDELAREEIILSATSTQSMEDEFDSAFALLNMVVYVVLVLAALLAFVVLFTLSNTNISERERELATIKVLGFYNPEVHSYVNKETWILTFLGILTGMPLGWLLGRYVMGILELPSLEFYIDLYPQSYLYASLITLIFAFAVNALTDKTLDKINMVEALKSVE